MITLDLTVNDSYEEFQYESLCDGELYNLGNQTLFQTGIYTETFSTSNGCDSIITLDIFFAPLITENILQNLCIGDSLLFFTPNDNR